jgi:uncharacterized damage-inducible protein DinB
MDAVQASAGLRGAPLRTPALFDTFTVPCPEELSSGEVLEMSYDVRPARGEYNDFYHSYVERVPDGDIVAILATQLDDTIVLVNELTDAQARFAYGPGKWSVKQVLGHIADAERIMAYRVLRFARGDTTPLASFDENTYAPAGRFDERPVASLVAELTAVRRATVALLAALPHDAWTREGTASTFPITVRALAWIIAGHELHHRAILAERYLPQLAAPAR